MNGPYYERGTNYYHVVATEPPKTQPGEVRIVALSLAELIKLSDKGKCYILKIVEALFLPFNFIGYESISHQKKTISTQCVKEIQTILDTPTIKWKRSGRKMCILSY